MKKKFRLIYAAFFAILIIVIIIFRMQIETPQANMPQGGGQIKTAVLYSAQAESEDYQDVLSVLDQSLMLNMTASAINVDEDFSLEDVDIIYPNPTIRSSPKSEAVKTAIIEFTENGGSVFLANEFYDFFDPSFIGAEKFKKIESYPTELDFPKISADYADTQSIIRDFAQLYPSDVSFERSSQYDYGYALVPNTAISVVNSGELALYSMNKIGDGFVFFTNPFLPNEFSVSGTELISRNEKQVAFSATSASANRIIYNAFAEFVSKQKHGYSLSRVFGSFGRPSMSWELHFEEITGMANNSAVLFAELAKENLQIPSYSMVRNAYTWFQRSENITYLLGEGGGKFTPEYYENGYSSGKHIATEGGWLSFESKADGGSYFEDYPDDDLTAAPWISDLDGDKIMDIISGSSDGGLYYCKGISSDKNFTVGEKTKLLSSDDRELSVSGQSAPVLSDIDGDGILDIVCGDGQGKIHVARGIEKGTYEPFTLLLQTEISGMCFPEIGDVDGDGSIDLLVGSDEGKLLCFFGKSAEGLEIDKGSYTDFGKQLESLGTWLAPRLFDLNEDGAAELFVGTFDGYVARVKVSNGSASASEFLTGVELNYKGNKNLKFGNNCMPFFADLNRDGTVDLACGSLEYGLNYPIDSPYFPYREQLQAQLDYIKENDFSLQPHFYTGIYASEEREDLEISMQLDAMESYGFDRNSLFGINQHTWHTSSLGQTQSFLSAFDKGARWNSGFEPSCSTATPQVSAENVIALPFFLTRDGEKTMLLQNCSVLPYREETWTDISARYGMPICIYYHCDLIHKSDKEARTYISKAEEFRHKHRYNFVREDQLMLASAAAQNLMVSAKVASSGTDTKVDITFTPSHGSEDFPLFDQRYASSSGYKISLGEAFAGRALTVDANVLYREGTSIYVSADAPVRLYEDAERPADKRLEQVNVPAKIKNTKGGVELSFLDGGMMQCVVSGRAQTENEGWTVEQKDGATTFTKFGKAEKLLIKY